MSARIRKGDTVVVVAGRSKGVRGTVLQVMREKNRVLVERANIVKRHTKPDQRNAQGGIIEKEAPVHISNVMLVHNGEPTRVAIRTVDGKKVRWSKKHDEAIDG